MDDLLVETDELGRVVVTVLTPLGEQFLMRDCIADPCDGLTVDDQRKD